MKRCLICNKDCKTGAGLAAHHRKAHPDFKGKNRRAVEGMIAELERQERLEALDCARVQILRSLADQLDIDPSNAQMWRTYSEVLGETVALNVGSHDAVEDEIEAIRGAAKVVNLSAVR